METPDASYSRTRSRSRRRPSKSSQCTRIDVGALDSGKIVREESKEKIKSLDCREGRAQRFARAKLIIERAMGALPGYGQKKGYHRVRKNKSGSTI
jgi:hypothetical protein